MEKNTVLLEVERYNELYNLEKAIKEGKKLVIERSYGYGAREYKYYYTEDEIITELKTRVEELGKENNKLEEKLKDAERKIPEPEKQITIEDIKQMNYWQFRKWKVGK